MLRVQWLITICALLCVYIPYGVYADTQLSTIPTARMNPQGTLSFKLETLDPFIHTSIGAQLMDSLYVQIRQSAEISSLRDSAEQLTPGLDFKLRLQKEGDLRPEIALGMNSALGHSHLASEYLTFSKRYKSFDFTGGMAWGKLGGAGHVKNPLGKFFSHFKKERPLNDQDDNSPDHWFTGDEIGFFGGLSYQTPWTPFSLNLDWSADRYAIEQNLVSDFNTPNPWSIGATLQVMDNASFHGAVVGGEKIMGRLVFDQNLAKSETKKTTESLPHRIRKGDKKNYVSKYRGLTGKQILLPERALYATRNSPAEMWHDLETKTPPPPSYFKTNTLFKPLQYRVKFEEKLSLSEEDTTVLFRSALLFDTVTETALGTLAGFGLRLNLDDNLDLDTPTPSTTLLTRNDERLFAQKRFAVDRASLSKNYSFKDVHTSLSIGYLEEMFAGLGGEILYRPYKKTYALGLEGWHVHRRDPTSNFNLKLLDNSDRWTGHINTYYELPNKNTTLHAKVGRYLGEDFGGTLALSHIFLNGINLTGSVTATNKDNQDVFGGTDNALWGLRATIPLKHKRLPKYLKKACCDIDFNITPLARDTGQTLKTPFPLYQTSESLSYRHLIQNWDDIRE